MAKPKTMVADYQAITVRIPQNIYAEICDVATEEDRSLNEQVVRIVKLWYVEQAKQKGGRLACPLCQVVPIADIPAPGSRVLVAGEGA